MKEELEQEPPLSNIDVAIAKRAEAAASGQASINWVMAALLTANGGAALALLGQPARGTATMVALGLYMLGVTCALMGGKIAADFAHLTEALVTSLIHVELGSRRLAVASRTGDPAIIADAEDKLQKLDAIQAERQAEIDKSLSPEPWLGCGILFFFFGCVAAGFALS